jgi:cell division septum initiation protein DivIVA
MSQSETIGGERPAGTDSGGLGARFARLFSPRAQPEDGLGETVEFTPEGVETQNGDGWAPRFATTWRGYDRLAVDEYLVALEDELAAVRAERIPEHAIQDEIDRFGNDTAEILRVARAKADAISSRAHAQADLMMAEAQAQAEVTTRDAEARRRTFDADADLIWRERTRLIDDTRKLADCMLSVADDATERFPPETVEPAQTPEPVQTAEPVQTPETVTDAAPVDPPPPAAHEPPEHPGLPLPPPSS